MKDFDIDNIWPNSSSRSTIWGAASIWWALPGRMGVRDGGARFPEKVNTLVIAGAPIDTDAGDGPIKEMAHLSPMPFYEDLVTLGGGLMRGKLMLRWKNMHPEEHYIKEHVDLYVHIDDPAYVAKTETFEAGTKTRLTCRGDGIFRRSVNSSRRTGSPRGFCRPRPPPEPQSDHLPSLSARRRERRYHDT